MHWIEKLIEKLAEKLRSTLEQMGVAEAHEKTGQSKSDISSFVHGYRRWSYEKIIRIAKILKVDIKKK